MLLIQDPTCPDCGDYLLNNGDCPDCLRQQAEDSFWKERERNAWVASTRNEELRDEINALGEKLNARTEGILATLRAGADKALAEFLERIA